MEFSDAAKVRERVETNAAQLRLRGARRHVLAAVLKLLCGWSKITDDRVGLPQIVELIAAAGGRRYDLKTIGRALAGLAADELIDYRPAQGRGTRSFIGIHDRFVGDVRVLERDRSGRVITDYSCHSDPDSVTFSEPLPYKDQTHYPPTPRPETQPHSSRPVAVNASTEDLREVLGHLPEPLALLPKHLRWMLGREIRQRLESGWRPDQILDVLAAPMPADVERPWRLALWRLRHNIVGSGPRLRPLQQAWDAQTSAASRAAAEDTTARWYAEVAAVTTAEQRAELLRADEVKFGRRAKDPVAALAAAGRRVARLFPEMALTAALARWAEDILADHEPETVVVEQVPNATSLSTDLLMELAISGGCSCVVCGSDRGIHRPQLPLKAMSIVCDQCWPHIAAELAEGADATRRTDPGMTDLDDAPTRTRRRPRVEAHTDLDDGRQPPQDLAAEQSVLGGMLLSKDAIADVLEKLRPGDFYRPNHQQIYDAILDLFGHGEPADAVTVAAELDRRGLLRRIGGAPYLHTLIATVPTAANAGYYAGIVAEKAVLRRLVEAGTRVVQYGYAGAEGADVAEVVDRAQAEIYDVTEDRGSEDMVALEDLLQPTMDEIDAIQSGGGQSVGVPTGFAELDEVTTGLHGGQMIIFAARPGQGKSTLALDVMRSCSIKHGMASVIFSLEMSKSEIVMRLLSAEARIKLADMRAGRMSDDDWTRMARRMSEITEAPLYIDDSPNLTMMEIRAKARRLKQKTDLRLVVVDYLQLMTSGKRVESRQAEVAEFSRSLKLLAKELDVPVIAISQLNRGPEQRTDKLPQLSDLRETGQLEQDADVVILINRPDGYDRDSPRAGEADLILAKHRNGPIKTCTVASTLHMASFRDLARGY